MVIDASDLNSGGRLLKVAEISESRCLNLSLEQNLCSASSKLAQIKSGGSSMENSEPQNAGEVAC